MLEAIFGAPDETPISRDSLENLRSDFKGFELTYRVLRQPGFEEECRFLYIALQVSWDYYTHMITTIKTPLDGFQDRIFKSAHEWWDV